MKVFVISGRAQHGKDTVARMMADNMREHGDSVIITHYADLLKYICKAYFNWDGEKDENGRHLLQYVGTDVVRSLIPNFWVNFIIAILKLFGDSWDYVIIPDARFPNEIDNLISAGFDVTHFRVIRPAFNTPLTSEQQAHASETALDDYPANYTIYNSDDLPTLGALIKDWIEEYVYENEKDRLL